MKKTLISIAIGLVVVVLLISVAIGIFISPIVKTGIETVGPKITQVSIKVRDVNVSLATGSASVQGLVVGNPKGYTTPEAIKLGAASVSLDPMSVFSDKIIVHKIHVKSPEITYDGGLGGSNLTKIMENVNAVAKAGGPETDKGAKSKPAPKLQVDDLLITGAKVHVNLKAVVVSQAITVPLPDIHLTNLGKGPDGITPTELIRTVLSQITTATVKAVTETVTNSGKMIEGLGKDLSKDLGKEAKDGINTIKKGIGGLLGK